MRPSVFLDVLYGGLLLTQLITIAENGSLRRQLSIFREWRGDAADAARLAAVALFVASLLFGSSSLRLTSIVALGAALVIDTVFDPLGVDASRHCELILCIGIGLVFSEATRPIGYAFMLINLSAMYAWAAIFKLRSRAWRRGEGLQNVLSSKQYGLNRWPPGPDLGQRGYLVASWGLMLLELSVIFVLTLGGVWEWVEVAAMLLLFHTGTAVIMGLRRFASAGFLACACLLAIRIEYESGRSLLTLVLGND